MDKRKNDAHKLYRFPLLLLFVFNAGTAFSEEAVTAFNERFALSLSGNYNIGIFDQQQPLGLRTNEPWNIGLGIRYKYIAVQASIPLFFNNSAFNFEFNSYFENLYFELFLKRYDKFYTEEGTDEAGLDVMAAGITAGWIHNHQNHSLSAVYSLDRKQNISSGSLLYGFGAFYTTIYSENSKIKHYDKRNHIIHFGPMGGYSYTWVLPHNMFINTGITIGANMGINTTKNKILFMPQIRPKTSFGHHNNTWSVNMVMSSNSALILWNAGDYNVFAPSTITITFSKRF